MQKTSQFKTQCKGDISHAFETAKITVLSHAMQNSTCALTKRAVVLNICTLMFIAYFYFMQIFIPLCVTHNSGVHYSRPNYVSITFKVGQGE